MTTNRTMSMIDFETNVLPHLRRLSLSESKTELLRAFTVGILGWNYSVSPILKTILGTEVMSQLDCLKPVLDGDHNNFSISYRPYLESFRGEEGTREGLLDTSDYDALVIYETNVVLCSLFEFDEANNHLTTPDVRWSNGIRVALNNYARDNDLRWPHPREGVLRRFLAGNPNSRTPVATPVREEPESFPEFIV